MSKEGAGAPHVRSLHQNGSGVLPVRDPLLHHWGYPIWNFHCYGGRVTYVCIRVCCSVCFVYCVHCVQNSETTYGYFLWLPPILCWANQRLKGKAVHTSVCKHKNNQEVYFRQLPGVLLFPRLQGYYRDLHWNAAALLGCGDFIEALQQCQRQLSGNSERIHIPYVMYSSELPQPGT